MKQPLPTIKNLFPPMIPIGFSETGEQLFSVRALADFFGEPLEDFVKQAEQIPGVKFWQVEVEKNPTTTRGKL